MKKIYLGLAVLLGLSEISFSQGDFCSTAVPVTPGAYVANGPNSGGGGQGGGAGFYNADWYSFVPNCSGTITISSCGSGIDTRLWVHNGTAGCPVGGGSVIANNDDYCAGYASQVNNVPVTGGSTYYIEWDNYWTGSGFSWNFTFTPTGCVCVDINTITSTGATVDWVENFPGATSFNVEYGLTGFIPGSGTIITTGSLTTTLAGLNALTGYDVYITPLDGACTSTSGPFSFTTLPICPEPINPNVTGLTTTTATLNWTPVGLETKWDVEWDTDGFLLGTGNQDFGLVATNDPLTGLTSSTDYHWYVRAVCDLNLGDGVDTTSFYVGPMAFTTNQACANPSAQNAINVTGFSSDITWTPGGLETEWNVYWGEAGFVPGGVGSTLLANQTAFPITLTGLTPNTSYQFYVQAVCGPTPDLQSMWIGPFTWNTPVYCNDPSGLSSTGFTTTTTDISWTAGGVETSWNLEYGPNGFTPGTGTASVETSTSLTLSGLTPGTDYCYYVQSICGTGPDSSSNWVGPNCFSTLVACPEPSNLGAINITNTAANLLWQAGGIETSWNVEWGLPGFTPGVGEEVGGALGTSSNPHYATGLTESNSYEFYVQADCGGTDGTSVWVGPYSFNTLLVNDIPCDAIELGVDGVVNTFSNALSTDNGEAAVVPGAGTCTDNMTWCGYAVINKPMWFKFKATATGNAHISTSNDVTTNYNNHTEIAVYEVGLCENYSTYTLLGANTGSNWDTGSGILSDPGSDVQICSGLTPGQDYYIMVDAFTANQYGWGGTEYTASSAPFGISISALPTADAGTAVPTDICENTSSFDLFTAITGSSATDGIWYYPDVQPGNEVPSTLDFTGVAPGVYSFYYVIGSDCSYDEEQTFVTVEAGPSAGGSNAITACNSGDIYLIQHLTGFPEMGGTWSDDDASGALVNGIFQSEMFAAGTYSFTYTVSSSGACPDATATVTITLDDCVGLGITVETENALSAYPNPVVDVLVLSNMNGTTGVIEVLDIQGKIVSSVQVSNVNGNYELNMNGLESGVYIVRLTTEDKVQEVRVVKQ